MLVGFEMSRFRCDNVRGKIRNRLSKKQRETVGRISRRRSVDRIDSWIVRTRVTRPDRALKRHLLSL